MMSVPVVIVVTSVLVMTLGLFSNSLSLSYFLRRANNGLGNRLLITLNAIDLIVCVSALKVALKIYIDNVDDFGIAVYVILTYIYRIALESTAFTRSVFSVSTVLLRCTDHSTTPTITP